MLLGENFFFAENDLEILIATTNQSQLDFLCPMFPEKHFSNYAILIVNQSETTTLFSEFPSVRVINSTELGLSKSRNLALDNARKKLLLLADDDVVYSSDFVAKIIKAANQFPQAAAVTFCGINEKGAFLKKYATRPKSVLNTFEILNVSSIEMLLNYSKIKETGIRFDEKFGLGAPFEMGEETVFLMDLKRCNQQIAFQNEVIVQHIGTTSSERIDVKNKYYIYGAVVSRALKKRTAFWVVLKLFFDLKQKKINVPSLTLAIHQAKEGRKKWKSSSDGR